MRNQTKRHLPNFGEVDVDDLRNGVINTEGIELTNLLTSGYVRKRKSKYIMPRFQLSDLKLHSVAMSYPWQLAQLTCIGGKTLWQPNKNGYYSNINLLDYHSRLGGRITQTKTDMDVLEKAAMSVRHEGTIFEFAGQRGFSTAGIRRGAHESVRVITSEMNPAYISFLMEQPEMIDVDIIGGDLMVNYHLIPDCIDFLFCDAEHDLNTCRWYIDNLWPKVVDGGLICVHDMDPDAAGDNHEYELVIRELDQRRWKYRLTSKEKTIPFISSDRAKNCMAVIEVPSR